MAQVIYSPHPLEYRKDIQKIEVPKGTTMAQICDELNCYGRELNISINGLVPDKINLTDTVGDCDLIYFRTNVQGGSASETNKIANIVQGIAVVASLAVGAVTGGFGFAATATLLGGQAVSTGLRAIAARQQASASPLDQESPVAAPFFSINQSNNPSRPYGVIPVVFGEHRVTPDYGSQPYGDHGLASPLGVDQINLVDVIRTNKLSTPFYRQGTNQTPSTWVAISWDPPAQGFSNPPVQNFLIPSDQLAHIGTLAASFQAWANNAILLSGYANRLLVYNPGSALDPSVTSRTTELIIKDNNGGANQGKYINFYGFLINIGASPSDYVGLSNYGLELESTFNSWFDDQNQYPFNSTSGDFSDHSIKFPSIDYVTYKATTDDLSTNDQSISHIFNFGFGDLDISDERIGNTPISNYRDVSNFTSQNNLDWEFINSTFVGFYSSPSPGNISHDNALIIQGTTLTNENEQIAIANDLAAPELPISTGSVLESNWFRRETPLETTSILLNFSSRSFQQGQVAINSNSILMQAQYAVVGTNVWTAFAGTGSNGTFTIGGNNMNLIRFRLTQQLPSNKYEFRVRRVTKDSSDSRATSEISLDNAVAFISRSGDKYIGQVRKSIRVKASGQLQGQIGKYNALVRARCFKYDGGATGTYTWDFSSNPADCFLYFLRGLFVNPTTSNTGTSSGIYNGVDINNGERLFGAGVVDDQIDFDSLQDWWNFCDTNSLEFNGILNKNSNVYDTLSSIASIGRASISFVSGKFGVVYENSSQIPIAVFGMENMLAGSFRVSYINERLPDEIKVTYLDSNAEWSQNEVSALSEGVVNATRSQTVNMWGITNKTQAQKEANILAARQFYQRRLINFETDAEGFILSRGDVILLSHDVTSWDESFRPVSMSKVGTNITEIISDKPLKSATFALVKRVDGTLQSYPATVADKVVSITMPENEAPGFLDQLDTVNAASDYTGSRPEDFLILMGDSITPGKPVRVIDIKPDSIDKIKVTCIDEEAAMYAHEFDGLPDPVAYTDPDTYTQIESKAFNLCAEQLGSGSVKLTWEVDGAIAAKVSVAVNGGTLVLYNGPGGITNFSREVVLTYAPGDSIFVQVDPVAVGVPYLSTNATTTVVLDT